MLEPLAPLEPITTVELFPGERAALLQLLGELAPADWEKPTACPGWSVHDVALHLLGADVNLLSGGRDAFAGPPGSRAPGDLADWSTLVAYIDGRNAAWVSGTRRLSPRLLGELLGFIGERVVAYLDDIDLAAMGNPVDWAGPGPAPVWLHVAREYAERWVHQQHIREAVAKPGLMDRAWSHPVLDAFARALPHTLRAERSPEGTRVALEITGEAGDIWLAERRVGAWALGRGPAEEVTARVTLDVDTAWRLFTRGLPPEKAAERIAIAGDPTLACRVLRMVTVIA